MNCIAKIAFNFYHYKKLDASRQQFRMEAPAISAANVQNLAAKEVYILDDGRVIGNVSADDVDMVEKIGHVKIEEASSKMKGNKANGEKAD